MRAAKVQASLRIRAVSPEPSLLAHTSSESRGTFRQKTRSLAALNGWACAVKICHIGMLEDTNSLDGAQVREQSKNKKQCEVGCIWKSNDPLFFPIMTAMRYHYADWNIYNKNTSWKYCHNIGPIWDHTYKIQNKYMARKIHLSAHHGECQMLKDKWASSWDYGTYHIADQRRLRRDCTGEPAHPRSLTKTFAVRIHEVWKQTKDPTKIRNLAPLDGCACTFDFMEDKKCHILRRWLK